MHSCFRTLKLNVEYHNQLSVYVGDDIHPHLPPPHRAMPRHDDPERTMNIMWSWAGTIYFFPKFSF